MLSDLTISNAYNYYIPFIQLFKLSEDGVFIKQKTLEKLC